MALVTPVFSGECTGRLAGLVQDQQGRPISGVSMSLHRLDTAWSRQLKVGADGKWIQVGLDVKEFEIRVNAPGYKSFKGVVKVPLGETQRLDITLEKAETKS